MNARIDPHQRLAFHLPPELEATAPAEARGLARDGVRLLVAQRTGAAPVIAHATFRDLPAFLDPGDLVVINTSATIPAAVDAVARDGSHVVVHLSTRLSDGRWVVEPRRPLASSTARWTGPLPAAPWTLGGGAHLTVGAPYRAGETRLWTAHLSRGPSSADTLVGDPDGELTWLARHGRPIRYGHRLIHRHCRASVPKTASRRGSGAIGRSSVIKTRAG